MPKSTAAIASVTIASIREKPVARNGVVHHRPFIGRYGETRLGV